MSEYEGPEGLKRTFSSLRVMKKKRLKESQKTNGGRRSDENVRKLKARKAKREPGAGKRRCQAAREAGSKEGRREKEDGEVRRKGVCSNPNPIQSISIWAAN